MLNNAISAFESYMEHKLKGVAGYGDDFDKCVSKSHTVLDFLVYNKLISEEDATQLYFDWVVKIYDKERKGNGKKLLEAFKAELKNVEESGNKWTLF